MMRKPRQLKGKLRMEAENLKSNKILVEPIFPEPVHIIVCVPKGNPPQIREKVTDPEIERIAVQYVIPHETAQGRVVESVEADNRGFDLISRKLPPENPKPAIDVRFIEVEHYRLKQDSVKPPVKLKEDATPYRAGGAQ